MTRKLTLYCWLLTPVLLLAYHYGPGQLGLARDDAARHLARAVQLEDAADWRGAMAAYSEALAQVPATDQSARWKLRLAHGKARLEAGEIPEAMSDFEGLLAEMEKHAAPATETDPVRVSLGTAQYYAGWLMRLEGANAEEWGVPVDGARQQFRLLAERTTAAKTTDAGDHRQNLEAVIRLARMDLTELQALPLPKCCEGCKNVSQKCRGQCASKSKKPAEKKQEDARGASSGQRPRGGS